MNILSTNYIVFFRYILHNSECPATVFSILEANGKTVTLTSDTLFDLLMLKLTNVYKKKTTVESRGPRWRSFEPCSIF